MTTSFPSDSNTCFIILLKADPTSIIWIMQMMTRPDHPFIHSTYLCELTNTECKQRDLFECTQQTLHTPHKQYGVQICIHSPRECAWANKTCAGNQLRKHPAEKIKWLFTHAFRDGTINRAIERGLWHRIVIVLARICDSHTLRPRISPVRVFKRWSPLD